jgi:DNA-binding transcriptional MocR family regulator
VYEFLSRGLFEPNVERVTSLLKPRRDAMLAALERELPEGASWSRPEGGYFVWLDLPGGASAADLAGRAAPEVAFVRGTDFFPGGGAGASSARLAFSFASVEQIDEGVARIAALIPATASV